MVLLPPAAYMAQVSVKQTPDGRTNEDLIKWGKANYEAAQQGNRDKMSMIEWANATRTRLKIPD